MCLSEHHDILARAVEETIPSAVFVLRDTIRAGLMEGQDPDVLQVLLQELAIGGDRTR